MEIFFNYENIDVVMDTDISVGHVNITEVLFDSFLRRKCTALFLCSVKMVVVSISSFG